MGLTPRRDIEYRRLSLDLAEMCISWEERRYKEDEQEAGKALLAGDGTVISRFSFYLCTSWLYCCGIHGSYSTCLRIIIYVHTGVKREATDTDAQHAAKRQRLGDTPTPGGSGDGSGGASDNKEKDEYDDEHYHMPVVLLEQVVQFIARLALNTADSPDLGYVTRGAQKLFPRALKLLQGHPLRVDTLEKSMRGPVHASDITAVYTCDLDLLSSLLDTQPAQWVADLMEAFRAFFEHLSKLNSSRIRDGVSKVLPKIVRVCPPDSPAITPAFTEFYKRLRELITEGLQIAAGPVAPVPGAAPLPPVPPAPVEHADLYTRAGAALFMVSMVTIVSKASPRFIEPFVPQLAKVFIAFTKEHLTPSFARSLRNDQSQVALAALQRDNQIAAYATQAMVMLVQLFRAHATRLGDHRKMVLAKFSELLERSQVRRR